LSSVKQNGAQGFDADVDIQKYTAVFDVVQIVLQLD
jgi:hypothetical protein